MKLDLLGCLVCQKIIKILQGENVKRNLFKGITIVLFSLFITTSLLANGILQYYVTKEKVGYATVIDNKNGSFSVVIELKERYKKEFAKLTGRNIGRRLQIIFMDRVLIAPIIKDKIDSGLIQVGDWKSAEEAFRFIETLRGSNKKQGMDTQ